jgi:hypothetical protein
MNRTSRRTFTSIGTRPRPSSGWIPWNSLNLGFSALELARIRRMVLSEQAALLKAWHDYFGNTTG